MIHECCPMIQFSRISQMKALRYLIESVNFVKNDRE